MSVASLRKIGALIREQRHVLLALEAPGPSVTVRSRTRYALAQRSHALLDRRAFRCVESQPEEVAEDMLLQGSPPAHGRQRLHDGFNVEEVVAEYNVLRACIHDVAEEHGIIIHGNDLRIVNRIIDEAIGLAVQTYATQLSLEIKEHRNQHFAFVANDSRSPTGHFAYGSDYRARFQLASGTADPSADKLLKVLRRNIEQLEKSVVDVIKANGDSSSEVAQKLERREIDLWPIVQSVVSELEPVISTTSVDLVNDVPADLRVFADAGLLSRVFENAIAFAINNAPRGIVRIEASDSTTDGVRCQVHHNGARCRRMTSRNCSTTMPRANNRRPASV